MSKNDEFEIEDIEPIIVNGMKMYKLGNEIHLTKGDAIRRVRELSSNLEAVNVMYDSSCNVIDMVKEGKVLHAIKLG